MIDVNAWNTRQEGMGQCGSVGESVEEKVAGCKAESKGSEPESNAHLYMM